MEKKFRIDLISTIIYISIFGALLYAAYLVLDPFIIPISWATVIATSSYPLHRFIKSKCGRREVLAASLTTSLMFFAVLIILLPIAYRITAEATALSDELVSNSYQIKNEIVTVLEKSPFAKKYILPSLNKTLFKKDNEMQFVNKFRSELVSAISFTARGIFEVLFHLFIFVSLLFTFYLNGSELAAASYRISLQLGGEKLGNIFKTLGDTVVAGLYGMFATAVVQGVLLFLGFLIFGAPGPLLFGFLTMVAALIPMAPPVIYSLVCLYIAFIIGNHTSAILIFIWCVILVSGSDNIVRPLFISKAANIPLVIVFFGVLGGIISFGMLGIFLGPALLTAAFGILKEVSTYSELQIAEH